jgi:indole-3-glycerol phosphate synthase
MRDAILQTETILDAIVSDKRKELERSLQACSLVEIQQRALSAPPVIDIAPRLRGSTVALIAEIKRASPAAGLLEEDFNPADRAGRYAAGGASGISVLTEEKRFLGSLSDLIEVRALLGSLGASRPPILRKDFLFHPYHLYEARAAGADAILLIVAILPKSTLQTLLELAAELELSAIVEVHDENQVESAIDAGAKIIGINNRDLRTFITSLEVSERLRPLIPAGPIVISESGIQRRQDIERLAAAGVDAVLVGEALMRSTDTTKVVSDFASVPSKPRA